MRTRGLRLEFDDYGGIKCLRKDPICYEKRKIRKVYGAKITEALLKSQNQLKQTGYSPNIQSAEEQDEDIKYVKAISDEICDRCYDTYSYCTRTLKRKLFEICSNIKRESNTELRVKILTKQMSIKELINTETVELAPEDVREKRRKEIEHHYIRNVILKSEPVNRSMKRGSTHYNRVGNRFDVDYEGDSDKALEPEDLNTINNLKRLFKSTKNPPNTGGDFKESSGQELRLDNRVKNNRIINDEVKLTTPPVCDRFKFENVCLRINARLNALPDTLSKPFLDPFHNAIKRLELLIQRSYILN